MGTGKEEWTTLTHPPTYQPVGAMAGKRKKFWMILSQPRPEIHWGQANHWSNQAYTNSRLTHTEGSPLNTNPGRGMVGTGKEEWTTLA